MFSKESFFVDRNINRAETLPASAFVSEEFQRLELDKIFSATWLLVPPQRAEHGAEEAGFLETLKPRGSRLPSSLLGRPLFLQRDWNDRLHCFPNVCTHAWHPLVEDSGTERAIVCPQHGRQFDTSGKFVAQAGFKNLENFPRESDNLQDLPLEQWEQFLFVNMGRPMAPLHEFLKDMVESIPGLAVSGLKRRSHASEVREVKGNWKQHGWNYMDNFHIRFIHRGPGGLADAVDLASYHTEIYKFSSLQWVYAKDPRNGFEPALLSPRFQDHPDVRKRVFALWWFIFPNMAFNFYPWGLSLNVYMPVPGQPNETLFLWYQYALDEEKFEQRNGTWLSEQVDSEDVETIAKVSQGARSGFAPRGRFAPKEEVGPHWFHRLVYETVFERPNKT